MAGVVFACSESSGIERVAGAVENTTATYHNAPRSRAAMINSGASQISRVILPAALSSARVHMVCYTTAADTDSTGQWWVLYDAAGVGILRLFGTGNGATGNIQYWNGSAWANLGASFSCFTLIGKIEMEIGVVTGVGGSAEVSFNGVSIASGAIGNATAALKRVDMRHPDDANSTLYSECIVNDYNRTLVGCFVETEAPTADGTDTAGTGTYADLDEAVNDAEATVLLLTNAGDQHSFTSPARTGTHADGHILAVTVAFEMRRDIGGPQSARFYLKIGGVRYYGDTFLLTTALLPYQYAWVLNPATAAAWTQAEAEAAGLEWGIEAVA